MREVLERQQVWIYFGCVGVDALAAAIVPGTERLEEAINLALAFMLFVTFLQVPIREIGNGFCEIRFLAVLLAANFIAIQLLAFLLSRLAPDDALLRLGVSRASPCPLAVHRRFERRKKRPMNDRK